MAKTINKLKDAQKKYGDLIRTDTSSMTDSQRTDHAKACQAALKEKQAAANPPAKKAEASK